MQRGVAEKQPAAIASPPAVPHPLAAVNAVLVLMRPMRFYRQRKSELAEFSSLGRNHPAASVLAAGVGKR
jgi:hypothetical protein